MKVGEIVSYQDKYKLEFWNTEDCNTIRSHIYDIYCMSKKSFSFYIAKIGQDIQYTYQEIRFIRDWLFNCFAEIHACAKQTEEPHSLETKTNTFVIAKLKRYKCKQN